MRVITYINSSNRIVIEPDGLEYKVTWEEYTEFDDGWEWHPIREMAMKNIGGGAFVPV